MTINDGINGVVATLPHDVACFTSASSVCFRLARFLPFLLALLLAPVPAGHALNSALLSLTEGGRVTTGRFAVRWEASSSALQADLATPAVFPAACKHDGAVLDCGHDGLVGTIELPWLEGTETNVMVVVEWRNGADLSGWTGNDPSLLVYGIPPPPGSARSGRSWSITRGSASSTS